MEGTKKFVLALDIGTTNVKCFIYDRDLQVVGRTVHQITLLYPEVGYCEIDPEELWSIIINIVKSAIEGSKVSITDIQCLGISSQRCTFITWDKNTQVPYHNFITWKDVRAEDLVQSWNNSFVFKAVQFISRCLYWITGNVYFALIATARLMNAQVTFRLLWILNNLPALRDADKRNVMFGTVDTWLLYKLTGGEIYCTDFSCASSTGMFDPNRMKWGMFLPWLGLPRALSLPNVCQSSGYHFGTTVPGIWGDTSIPITCVMADQMASIYGTGCKDLFDVKVTLGTGGFLDINTGPTLRVSKNGLYPLIGWVMNDEVVYVLEGCCYDVGTVIDWIKAVDLCDDVSLLSEIAYSVPSCQQDLYFLPTTVSLQKFANSSLIAHSFVGIKPTTTKAHMIRAILESIVFRMYRVYRAYEIDNINGLISLWMDGGVSRNDFACQCLADMIGVYVKRSVCADCSATGVAFIAGLTAGVWKSKDDIERYIRMDKMFTPNVEHRKYLLKTYEKWSDVMNCLKTLSENR